jgi:rhomboid family GlyGly-CTERM serine protease
MLMINARQNKWLFCLGISACALVLWSMPDALADYRYDRAAILSGEWWRIVTGHMVHLNTMHLTLNLVGLLLICELLWRDLPLAHACGLLLFSVIGASALLWTWHPGLDWYAGLSGALHGLWAGISASGWWSTRSNDAVTSAQAGPTKKTVLQRVLSSLRNSYIWALVLLALKLAMEFRYGPSLYTETVIEGSVISAAHLYGALAGFAYVLTWCWIDRLKLGK